MSELPLKPLFPLIKTPCNPDCKKITDVSSSMQALYHPEMYLDCFLSADSVSDWLSALFSISSGTNAPFLTYFSYDTFIVCNLSDRSTITLTVLDISNSSFHPWSLLSAFSPLILALNHPVWFYFQKKHYLSSLIQLQKSDLVSCLKFMDLPHSHFNKAEMTLCIFEQFMDYRSICLPMSLEALASSVCQTRSSSPSLSMQLYYHYFCSKFGKTITDTLLIPENFYHSGLFCGKYELQTELFSVTDGKPQPLTPSPSLTKITLKSVLTEIHISRRPPFQDTFKSRAIAIVESFRSRCKNLLLCNLPEIYQYILCWEPLIENLSFSFRDAIFYLLKLEYSSEIVIALTKSAQNRRNMYFKEERATVRQEHAASYIASQQLIAENWPILLDDEIIYSCLHNYRNATNWSPAQTCACCCRTQHKFPIVNLTLDKIDEFYEYLNFHLLQCTTNHLLSFFVHLPGRLQGLMLDLHGLTIVNNDKSKSVLHICQECKSQLQKKKLPRFALANHLFRGELPDEFKDLTWVEEMTCSIYRCTAHISRLYQSSDPAQPRVFHGNTCAHDMNIISTASVLPRTPNNVNDMLSVVFIGSGKYKKECLKNMFRVRKKKIWDFLVWLKDVAKNPLYANITLDPYNANLYPDDDSLPGVEECMVHD